MKVSSPALLVASAALATALTACPRMPPPTGPDSDLGFDEQLPDRKEGAADEPFTDEERAQSGSKLGGIWATCASPYRSTSDAADDLAQLSRLCGPTTGLSETAPARSGESQVQDDPAERFTFLAQGGKCYRVFVVGVPTVENLDVTVLDPLGKPKASDTTQERFAVVPARGPLCVEQDGVLTLEVSVTEGYGSFQLQVWGG